MAKGIRFGGCPLLYPKGRGTMKDYQVHVLAALIALVLTIITLKLLGAI